MATYKKFSWSLRVPYIFFTSYKDIAKASETMESANVSTMYNHDQNFKIYESPSVDLNHIKSDRNYNNLPIMWPAKVVQIAILLAV